MSGTSKHMRALGQKAHLSHSDHSLSHYSLRSAASTGDDRAWVCWRGSARSRDVLLLRFGIKMQFVRALAVALLL